MGGIHKLSPLQVKRASKPCRISDGGGLYLRVQKQGSKSWMFRKRHGGVLYEFTIGTIANVSLLEARKIAESARHLLSAGDDPKAALVEKSDVKTFKDAALAIIKRRSPSWKSEKTAIKWRRGLMEEAAPLHNKPVSSITISDVESVIRPIWYTKNHSARMFRGYIEQALDLATVLGWRSGDNPARWKGALEHLLPDHKPVVKSHPALGYDKLPGFFSDLISSRYDPREALAFTILTASRGHMVRDAVWDEFNLNDRVWIVPVERMKRSEDDHIVPLTDEMLRFLPKPSTGLVFPYRRGKFSENAFKSTLDAMGYLDPKGLPITGHGFRSTFKDWAADKTDYPDEVSELALAHKVGSKVRRAYRRGKGLEMRRKLLEDWCSYVTGKA